MPKVIGVARVLAGEDTEPREQVGTCEVSEGHLTNVYFVRWSDAERQQTNCWESLDEYEKEFRDCVSVGFLIRDGCDHVVVCGSMSIHPGGADQVLGLTVIPKSCIKEMKKVCHFEWPLED